VRLTVIGCSPAWPNPGAAQSGYLLEGEGRLLIDCGPGVLSRLREREPWPSVDAIVLTHTHLDHTADLVGWLWGALMGPGRGRRQPELWVPPGGLELEERLPEAFAIREYAVDSEFEAAGFRISAHDVNHPNGHGLRISDGTRLLAHSGDSGPTDALVELARAADLFLCEATQAEDEPASMHLRASDALAVAEAAGARRLVLIHRPAELPVPEGCEVAYEGLELDV
jgi:ribonuclease BN (tRNA processing enzyme)